MRIAATAIAAAALAIGASACSSEDLIDQGSAEDSVTDVVSQQSGFEPKDVSCPDDAKAETGEKFTCTFTGPDGDYEAEVTVGKIDGENATLNVSAAPADK